MAKHVDQPMCMDNVTDPATCPLGSAISSGIVWNEWTRGNLPAFETLTSTVLPKL